jgi:hypothetical protein
MNQIKHKELDRQLEIRIDKRESIRHVFVKGSKELYHLEGEIEAYKDIRELYKHLKSCNECSMENLQ